MVFTLSSGVRRPLGVCSTEGREAAGALEEGLEHHTSPLEVTRYRVLGYFRSHHGDYSLVQAGQLDAHGYMHLIDVSVPLKALVAGRPQFNHI